MHAMLVAGFEQDIVILSLTIGGTRRGMGTLRACERARGSSQ
jgi:hypothetical protein